MHLFPPYLALTSSARLKVLVPPPQVFEHSCNIDQFDHWQSTGGLRVDVVSVVVMLFVVVVVVVVLVVPSLHSTSIEAFSPALQLAQP